MKTKIKAKEFKAKCEWVASIIPNRTTLEVLKQIHCSVEAGGLCLRSTNLDCDLSVRLPSETVEPGVALVSAEALLCHAGRELDFELTADDKQAEFFSRAGFRSVPSMAAEEFTPERKIISARSFQVNLPAFQRALRAAKFFIGHDESRYVLRSACLEIGADTLTVTCVDGRRLFTVELPHLGASGNSELAQILLPAVAVEALLSLPEEDLVLTVNCENLRAQLVAGDFTIFTKLTDGTFPIWRQVVPNEEQVKQRLIVNVADFKAASHFAREASDAHVQCGVRLLLSKNNLLFSTARPDYGTSKSSLTVLYDGPELQTTFQPQFLIDLCDAMSGSPMMQLEFSDEISPLKVTSGSAMAVIMPMRIA